MIQRHPVSASTRSATPVAPARPTSRPTMTVVPGGASPVAPGRGLASTGGTLGLRSLEPEPTPVKVLKAQEKIAGLTKERSALAARDGAKPAAGQVSQKDVDPFLATLPPVFVAEARARFNTSRLAGEGVDAMKKEWGDYVLRVRANGNVDINALVQAVLRQAYMDATLDLRMYAERVKFYNDLKKRIREHVQKLREFQGALREWERENKRDLGDAWLEAETESRTRSNGKVDEVVIDRRRRDPLILDLDGDGIELDAPSGAGFLINQEDERRTDVTVETFNRDDGDFVETVRRTTTVDSHTHSETRFKEWVGADDGLLVMDRNGDGQIQAEDLFGDESVTGRAAANGFEDLKALDGNGDGIVDAKDAKFSDLRVWQDKDRDGKVDNGELLSMGDAKVSGLYTAYEESADGAIKQKGSYKSARAAELEQQMSAMGAAVGGPSDIDTTPTADGQAPGFVRQGAAFSTSAEVEVEIKKHEENLQTVGDDAQLANVDLQNMMQRQQQLVQMMSNISKMLHDTALSVIRKLAG